MKTVVSKANANATSGVVTTTTATLPAIKTEPGTTETNLQFQTPINTSPNNNVNTTGATKRPISLDLNKNNSPAKKPRLQKPLTLESADINTPDLEKIFLSDSLLPTPQPGAVFPSKIGTVTTEQEEFGKGFEEALHSLHNSKNCQVQANNTVAVTAADSTTTVPTGMSGGSFTYTNLESSFPVAIKDEPQNPGSPSVSPIDMEAQEKIKLERKRQRNRVAASKCRKRKLERISKLEDKVKILKGENGELSLHVKTLKDHVAQLKQQVIEHIESGCSIPTICNGTTVMQGK